MSQISLESFHNSDMETAASTEPLMAATKNDALAEPGDQFNKLSVMHFAESLVLKESDHQVAAPTAAQIIDTTEKAVDHPDVQTIFFVGFPPSNLDALGTKKLKKLVDMVQSWQAWSSSICESNVQQQIDKEALSAAPEGQFARSTHRTKVFDYLFRQATWYAALQLV